MKIKVAILVFILCVATTASAFARGGYYGGRGGYYDGYHGRSNYYGHSYRSRHHHDGVGIAVGVVGGLILGSALASAAAPPPPTVVYREPYTVYQQPQVVVQQPRFCVEERRVSGEWQMSQFDGRQIWVEYPYPITQKIQVPCY